MKKLRLISFCSFLILAGNGAAFSQEPTRISPSPSASTGIENMQSSVLNTGAINVNVPLYTVSSGDMQVPIGLTYRTSGIKVKDIPSCVGQGWNYTAGGKITRVVNKWPDGTSPNTKYNKDVLKNTWFDWNNDYKFMFNNLFKNYYEWVTEYAKHYYGDKWPSNISNVLKLFGYKDRSDYDTEPDIFYFETPTVSGMFVLDHDGVPVTIPYQDININYVDREYFTITDQSGIRYVFGSGAQSREISQITRDNSNMYNADEFSYTSTWWLDEIKDINDNKIELKYVIGFPITVENISYIYSYKFKLGEKNPEKSKNKKALKSKSVIKQPKYISEISARGFRVDFESGWRREISNYTMDGFKVYHYDSKPVKEIRLEYSQFPSNKYLRLDKIYEVNSESMDIICEFNYNSTSLPSRDSFATDHWGYYNGETQNEGFPGFHIQSAFLKYPGDNKEPHLNYSKAHILTAIKYPNGKSTEYEYEQNYVKSLNSIPSLVGGVRVAKVTTKAPGVEAYSVDYSYNRFGTNETSGVGFNNRISYHHKNSWGAELYVNVYPEGLHNIYDLSGNHLQYSEITEIYPDGSKITNEYTTNDSGSKYRDLYGRDIYVDDKGKVTVNSYEDSKPTDQVMPTSTRFWRRGLLTAVRKYNPGSTKPFEVVRNEYSFGEPKKIVECFSRNDLIGLIDVYDWISEPVLLSKTVIEKSEYNLGKTVTYEYNPKTLLLVKKTETDREGNRFDTEIKYSSDYNTLVLPLCEMASALKKLFSKRAKNVPVEIITCKNDKVMSGSINTFRVNEYGHIVTDKIYSLKLPTLLNKSNFKRSDIINRVFTMDARYECDNHFIEYDGVGNLIDTKPPHSPHSSLVYGYSDLYPIAEIHNARYSKDESKRLNEVFHTSFEDMMSVGVINFNKAKSGNKVRRIGYDINLDELLFKPGNYILSYWKHFDDGRNKPSWEFVEEVISVNADGNNIVRVYASPTILIDELRIHPADALMKTKTYQPGVGVTSETDNMGLTTSYGYDDWGGLVKVYDNDRVLIKEIKYDNVQN